MPFLLALRDAETPVEQISDVGENLAGRAGGLRAAIVGKTGGGVADGFASAIGERGHGVAK